MGVREKADLIREILTTYVRVRAGAWRRPLPEVVSGLRARARSGGQPGALPGPDADPWQLSHAVDRVLTPLPTDSRCLMKSLVVLEVLERRGLPATLVIGAATEPAFVAHAWVERDGQAVLPSGNGKFSRLTEL